MKKSLISIVVSGKGPESKPTINAPAIMARKGCIFSLVIESTTHVTETSKTKSGKIELLAEAPIDSKSMNSKFRFTDH